MIKLKETINSNGNRVVASLFSDTKEEVKDNLTGIDVVDLSDDAIVDAGSTVVTADWQAGQIDSEGHWHWA